MCSALLADVPASGCHLGHCLCRNSLSYWQNYVSYFTRCSNSPSVTLSSYICRGGCLLLMLPLCIDLRNTFWQTEGRGSTATGPHHCYRFYPVKGHDLTNKSSAQLDYYKHDMGQVQVCQLGAAGARGAGSSGCQPGTLAGPARQAASRLQQA